MQSKLSQRVELFANFAIILVAVILGVVLVQRFFFPSQPNIPQAPPEIVKGTKMTVEGVDWNQNQKTLILALQKGCKYCTESMPFYKSLVGKAKESGVKLVAVLPNSLEEGTQYLKENGVEIQEIKQATLNSVNVRGTPTLILVNGKGEVENSWIGKLPNDEESKVIGSF